LRGAPVISDYGHHPTAIRETVEGAKQFYPGKRIVLAFQPHQRNRTRKLFNEFVSSFDGADVLLLPEIFDVTGRESSEDSEVSSRQLVDAVLARDSEHGRVRDVVFADSLGMLKDEIDKRVQSDDVVILMGAGNIYTIANALGA
jgi:UDP-N-acetylmuramate--alanine ligase